MSTNSATAGDFPRICICLEPFDATPARLLSENSLNFNLVSSSPSSSSSSSVAAGAAASTNPTTTLDFSDCSYNIKVIS